MSEPDEPIDMDTEHSPAPTQSKELCSGSGSGSQSQRSNMQSSKATVTPSESQHSKGQPTSGNVVIDVDKEPNKVERREMVTRSDMWEHFIQVKNAANVVVVGKCKYCSRPIKAESKGYGTSALWRHFNGFKRNPHKLAKDPSQALLQRTPGETPGNLRTIMKLLEMHLLR